MGGAVITGIGIEAVRHVRDRRHLGLACLPLLLGAHQLIEAFVWWALQGHVPHALGRVALWCYLLIALVVLPVFVPAAVMWSEATRRRQWVMGCFVAIGAFVSGVLLVAMLRGPVGVSLRPYHLSYHVRPIAGLLVICLYVLAVCGSLLLSSSRNVRIFGLVNFVAVGVIAWLTIDGFASVWCGWAAVTSAAIALRMRLVRRHGETRLALH